MYQDEVVDEKTVRSSKDAFSLAADAASQQNSEMEIISKKYF